MALRGGIGWTAATLLVLGACGGSGGTDDDLAGADGPTTTRARATTATTDADTEDDAEEDDGSSAPLGPVVFDARDVGGTAACDNAGQVVGAASPTLIVVDCGEGRYAGVDLAAQDVVWTHETPPPDSFDTSEMDDHAVVNTTAGLFGAVQVETTTATGFEGEKREAVVTAFTLEEGDEVYSTELPRPQGTIDETQIGETGDTEPQIEVMGADGTMIVRMAWPMAEEPWAFRLYGIAPDGEVAWQNDTSAYVFVRTQDNSREYVELAGANLLPDVISIKTGASALTPDVPALDEGSGIYSDGCSSIFTITTIDSVTVLDAATGQAHTIPTEVGRYPTTNTPLGVYVDGSGEVASRFVTPTGVAWTIGAGLSTSPQEAYGRLFIQNQSGTLLEVDQATGEPLSTTAATLPPEGFPVDGGILAAEPAPSGGTQLTLVDAEVLCG